jgi:RimJ/RimL family protein N-acetyltransferase
VTTHSLPAARPVILAGGGLVLRKWTDADLLTMIELFDDPSVDRWTPLESPFDQDAARRYLARAAARRLDGTALQFAITEDDGPPLGELLIFDSDGQPTDGSDVGADVAEFGYSVGLRYRGHGLAARAVRLAIEQAAVPWGLRLLRLRIEVGNVASERVAADSGFARVEQPPQAVWSKGRSIELALWERALDGPEAPDTRPARLGLK